MCSVICDIATCDITTLIYIDLVRSFYLLFSIVSQNVL